MLLFWALFEFQREWNIKAIGCIQNFSFQKWNSETRTSNYWPPNVIFYCCIKSFILVIKTVSQYFYVDHHSLFEKLNINVTEKFECCFKNIPMHKFHPLDIIYSLEIPTSILEQALGLSFLFLHFRIPFFFIESKNREF